MNVQELCIGQRRVILYHIGSGGMCPIVYVPMEPGEGENIASRLDGKNLVLAAVEVQDWAAELSPWPVSAAFKGGDPFSGQADLYLHEWIQHIVPTVECSLDFVPTQRIIAGYSLAGLFAVYALYKTDLFQRVLSASGSMWFDHFVDYAKKNQLQSLPDKAYFSLGKKEVLTKNKRMAVVEERTQELIDYFRNLHVDVIFEMNDGGHFNHPDERMAQGIAWIIK